MDNKNLKLPANCARMNEEEMTYTQGGGIVAEVFWAFGRMFRNTHVSKWNSEVKKVTDAHGGVVSQNGNVYTCSDGHVYVAENGSSVDLVVGDFFYGIGDLFNAFGL